jgi:outer membrane protein assembly factor BamB
LDSNRTLISDIYSEVRALDGNWSETINEGEYVRVVFEQELDSTRDITIYPRGTGSVEVYEVGQEVLIAKFDPIVENEYNKIYLTNLNGTQDTFDLKVVNGSLEFDHIIDPIGNTSSSEGDEWTMFGRDLNHTSWDGVDFYVIGGLNSVTFTTGDTVDSSPAIANGYVYIGSNDDKLYQLNASNVAQEIASFTTGGNVLSPVIANGYVYVGSSDKLYQLNASNVSQQITNFTAGSSVVSSAVVFNHSVYIGSEDSKLYQLNASNVSQQIAYFTTGSYVSSSPAIANGYVYVGSYDHKLYQLNASDISQEVASFTAGNIIASSPAVFNHSVYVGSFDDKVHQLNASNVAQEIASFTTGDHVDSSPAVANGYVYVGSSDDKLYQLNASNVSQEIASFTMNGDVDSSPAIANGYVYIGGGYDNKLYQLNASDISQEISSAALGSNVVSSPAIANGYVYIGGGFDDKLYQLNASNINPCTDVDGDGFGVAGEDDCTYPGAIDCDDTDIDIMPWFPGFDVNRSLTICQDTYYANATPIQTLSEGAITISEGGVTLDCNGAVFKNNFTVTGAIVNDSVGISTSFGLHSISIINCTLENYNYGTILRKNGSSVSYSNFSNNVYGLFFQGGNHTAVNNSFYNNSIEGQSSGIGIHGSNVTVDDNTFEQNQYGVVIMDVGAGPENNVIKNNVINNSILMGVLIAGANNTVVTNNLIENAAGAAVYFGASPSTSTTNYNNNITYNRIINSGLGVGIYLFNFSDGYIYGNYIESSLIGLAAATSFDLDITNNIFNISSEQGVKIDATVSNVTLLNNTFIDCGNVEGGTSRYYTTATVFEFNGTEYNGSILGYGVTDYVDDGKLVGGGALEAKSGASDYVWDSNTNADLIVNGTNNLDLWLVSRCNSSFGGPSVWEFSIFVAQPETGWNNCDDVNATLGTPGVDRCCEAYVKNVWIANGVGNAYIYNATALADAGVTLKSGLTNPPIIKYDSLGNIRSYEALNFGANYSSITNNTFKNNYDVVGATSYEVNISGDNNNVSGNNFLKGSYTTMIQDDGTGNSFCVNNVGNFYQHLRVNSPTGECGDANVTTSTSVGTSTATLGWSVVAGSYGSKLYDIYGNNSNNLTLIETTSSTSYSGDYYHSFHIIPWLNGSRYNGTTAYAIFCSQDWGAWSAWSTCASSSQSRTRTDSTACSQSESQSCTEETTTTPGGGLPPADDDGEEEGEDETPEEDIPEDEVPEVPEECIPVWSCGDWGSCSAYYDVEDVLNDDVSVAGLETRICSDSTGCAPSYDETQTCLISVSVNVETTEEGVEFFDEDGYYIGAVSFSDILGVPGMTRMDIFFGEAVASHCKNGIVDEDETDVDCGGNNCVPCIQSVKVSDWVFWLKLVLWILFLILVTIEAYVQKWYEHESFNPRRVVTRGIRKIDTRILEKKIEGFFKGPSKSTKKVFVKKKRFRFGNIFGRKKKVERKILIKKIDENLSVKKTRFDMGDASFEKLVLGELDLKLKSGAKKVYSFGFWKKIKNGVLKFKKKKRGEVDNGFNWNKERTRKHIHKRGI